MQAYVCMSSLYLGELSVDTCIHFVFYIWMLCCINVNGLKLVDNVV